MSAPSPAKKDTRRKATFADLQSKPKRTREVVLKVPDEDGEIIEFVVTLKAVGSKAYDDLMANHPPTPDQKKDGAQYNPDTFGPALIAACSFEPYLTPKEASELWNSEDWSRGEVMELFIAAVEVCSKGLDVPFTAVDSGTTAPST
jgi:hypothetical protein